MSNYHYVKLKSGKLAYVHKNFVYNPETDSFSAAQPPKPAPKEPPKPAPKEPLKPASKEPLKPASKEPPRSIRTLSPVLQKPKESNKLQLNLPSFVKIPDMQKSDTFYNIGTPEGQLALKQIRDLFKSQREQGKLVDIQSICENIAPTARVNGVAHERSISFYMIIAFLFTNMSIQCHTTRGIHIAVFSRLVNGYYADINYMPNQSEWDVTRFDELVRDCKYNVIVINLIVELSHRVAKPKRHMNLLVINKSKKTVRVFEPNGWTNWTEAVEETVKTYVMPKLLGLMDYKLIEAVEWCPRYGPQGITKDRFCAAWSSWFAANTILNPEADAEDVYDALLNTPDLGEAVKRYTRLVERMVDWSDELTQDGDNSYEKFEELRLALSAIPPM